MVLTGVRALQISATVTLLAVGGCGGSGSAARKVVQRGRASGPVDAHGRASGIAEAMLLVMTEDQKIQSASEATAARRRAIRTELATLTILKELAQLELSKAERADKKREVDSLRKQYKREMAPIEAFHRDLEHKVEAIESFFARQDPEVERLRGELRGIVTRKGKNEHEEIERVRREFERRRQELARE